MVVRPPPCPAPPPHASPSSPLLPHPSCPPSLRNPPSFSTFNPPPSTLIHPPSLPLPPSPSLPTNQHPSPPHSINPTSIDPSILMHLLPPHTISIPQNGSDSALQTPSGSFSLSPDTACTFSYICKSPVSHIHKDSDTHSKAQTTCTRTRMHMHTCTRTRIHTLAYTPARTHTHMHTHARAHTCTHARTHAHAHTHTHTHTQSLGDGWVQPAAAPSSTPPPQARPAPLRSSRLRLLSYPLRLLARPNIPHTFAVTACPVVGVSSPWSRSPAVTERWPSEQLAEIADTRRMIGEEGSHFSAVCCAPPPPPCLAVTARLTHTRP